MNAAHLHVILNHIPVVGIPLGALLLLYGLLRRNEEVKRASLLILLGVVLIAVPTFFSGKSAEDMVEHLPGVREQIIEKHEQAATAALVSGAALGLLAAGGLVLSLARGALPFPFALLLLFFALALSGWLGRVANLGGKIRHPEFDQGASRPAAVTASEEAPGLADTATNADPPEEERSGRRGRGRGRGRGGREH